MRILNMTKQHNEAVNLSLKKTETLGAIIKNVMEIKDIVTQTSTMSNISDINLQRNSINNIFSDLERNLSRSDLSNAARTPVQQYRSTVDEIYSSINSNNGAEGTESIVRSRESSLSVSLNDIIRIAEIDAYQSSTNLITGFDYGVRMNTIYTICMLAVISIGALIFNVLLNRDISEPVDLIRNMLENALDGKLPNKKLGMPSKSNELYQTAMRLDELLDIISGFMVKIKSITSLEDATKSDYEFKGVFRESVDSVNKSICSTVDKLEEHSKFLECLEKGDFTFRTSNLVIENTKNYITDQLSKMTKIAGSVGKGERFEIQNQNSSGEWQKILKLISDSNDAVLNGLKDVKNDLNDMDKAMSTTSSNNVAINEIFKVCAANKALISKYIDETCQVITGITNGRSYSKISNEYKGHFQELRTCVNLLVDKTDNTGDYAFKPRSDLASMNDTSSSRRTSSTAGRASVGKNTKTSGSVQVRGFSGDSVYNRKDFGKY